MFLLKLFGAPGLEDPSGPLTGRAVQRRRIALLAVLALEHPRAVTRDKLISFLWPEHDTDRARHLLRDSLYLLRGALGEDSVLSAGDELRLNPERLHCDVWEFERALEQHQPEAAASAYAGGLLDGFHAGDAGSLEHWFDGHRARLALAYAETLESLAMDAAAGGDTTRAVAWWRRLAAVDPYNSRVTLRLMEVLESAGDRAGAIQQARVHATLLEEEFGAEPDPDVNALAERMRAEPVAARSAAHVPSTPEPDAVVAVAPEPAAVVALTPDAGGEAHLPKHDPAELPARPRAMWRHATAVSLVAVALAVLLAARGTLPGLRPRASAILETAAAGEKTIAVLPFVNSSSDPEEDYFSDGLTDELIGTLSRLRGLRPVARTSAFAFKGKDVDVREIGRVLNVGTVLEGSVRKEAGRVRVVAQLIDVETGFPQWSETYDREVTDVLAIQSDLALDIARALEAELSPAERKRVKRPPTRDPQAYVLYLKGRYFFNLRTSSGLELSIDYFERAIDIDPRFAAAYAGLASVYSLQGLAGQLAPAEASARTRAAATKAIELDDELAEGHTALGGYFHAHEWDSDAAEREHLRAIDLDPNYSTARHWYGNLLASTGRFEEAVVQKTRAVELDPLTPHLSVSLAGTLVAQGRTDEAVERLRNALELDSTYWGAHLGLAALHERMRRFDEAAAAYRRTLQLAAHTPQARAGLGRVLALTGRKDEARVLLAELQAEAVNTGLHYPVVATVMLALDDEEGALDWLEQSYRERHPQLRFIGEGDGFAPLAGHPRFMNLLRRVGLRE